MSSLAGTVLACGRGGPSGDPIPEETDKAAPPLTKASSTEPIVEPTHDNHRKEITMFIALAVILALAWVLGFTVFHVASVAIHLLVLAAIVSVVVHFVRRGKRTT